MLFYRLRALFFGGNAPRNHGLGRKIFVVLYARARGDKFTDYDVLFKTDKRVDFVLDGGFGKHSRGFLEGRCGKETFLCERGFGDTEKYSLADRGTKPRFETFHRFFFESVKVYLFAGENIRVAGVFYLNLLHHLTNDDFYVLVVDVNALRTVNALNFFKNIILNALDAFGL